MRAAARGYETEVDGGGGGAMTAGMGYEEGELELEEGEAVLGGGAGCGGSAADEGFDPDALIVIDEKLQRLLGVFQKKFEGEISAENLGSQYGGYGSFLPTHPHSPLDVSQSRSLAVPPPYGSASRSPYVPMETPQKNNLIKTALDSSRRIDHYHQVSNGSNGNPCPQMLTKAVHAQEQKAPKLRIKVHSNRCLARNTADIYSGLGLDISPSSSVEGSLDGSAGAPVPDDLHDESPHTIFKIMTCYSVPGGLLLSPLAENALELREKPMVVLEEYKAPELHDGKAELHREWTCTTAATLNNRDRMIRKQSVEKKDNISDFKQSELKCQNPPFVNKGINPQLPDISDDTGSVLLPSTLKTEHSVEPVTFMSEISDQRTETKNDALKGHIFAKNKENKKEPSRALVFLGKTKSDSDESNSRSFPSSHHLQNASNENRSLESEAKTVYIKVEQCQYKGKEMGNLPTAESVNVVTENVDRNSSGMIKVDEEKTSSQAALPRRKIRVKAHKQLKDDTTRNSYGKDEKHAGRNDLASVHLSAEKLKPEIGTIASEVIDNKSCGNTVDKKINSSFIMDKSDPMSSACRNENAESSTALTAPASVVINEEWVCCDKCEKWRLLPYGMNPDTLPRKWRCSMLSWLPGMNSCKISEDDTTRALRALYMVPALENNILDGHHDNFAADIGNATATTSKGNIQSMSTPGKLNGCHDGANMVNNLNLKDMPKPSKKLLSRSSRNSGTVDCFSKPREKRKHTESLRKGENVGKDRIPPNPMRSSIGVDHDNLRASKKLKKEINEPASYHSTQFVTGKNSPSVNEASINMRKHIDNSPSMENYGPSSSGKHYHGEDKHFSDEVVKTSGKAKSDVPNLSIKKKKSKESLLSQHEPDHLPSNTIAKCTPKQSEINVVMEKPWTELKFPKADRAVANGRGGVTGVDDINIGAEKVCIEKHQENINLQHSLPSESSTRQNICHTKTGAATSSSSKVSNSHKDKVDFQGTKASPVESVSSSPLRTSDKNPLDQTKRHSSATTENVHSQELGKKSLARSKRKYDFGSDSDQDKPRVSGCFSGGRDHHGVKDSVSDTKNGQFKPCKEQKANSVSLSLHDNHNQKQLTSRENGKTQPHFYSDRRDHTNLISGNNRPVQGNIQYKDLKINPSTVKGSKQHPALNNAGNGDVTFKGKKSEKAVIVNLEARKQVITGEGASNPLNASVLLKEAKDLKHLSKRLKEKGEDFESTSMCFEAALKFLHVASLWEAPSTDSSKQVDPIHAMQLFSETGNLCGFCAHEFERLKKMANAALAYKCMEVAYMKAAFFKHPGAIKDRHALQTASLMAPPVESPSSSASDIDNLNNQSTAAKTVSVRGVYSPQIASNPISRNNHHMMGLLAYVEDINNAFEGTRKSQNSFSIYLSSIGKNQVDDVSLVREILDFSFHNVKGLLQLIRQSLESINHESVK